MNTEKAFRASDTGDRFKPIPGTNILVGRTYKFRDYQIPDEEITRRRIEELKNQERLALRKIE